MHVDEGCVVALRSIDTKQVMLLGGADGPTAMS